MAFSGISFEDWSHQVLCITKINKSKRNVRHTRTDEEKSAEKENYI